MIPLVAALLVRALAAQTTQPPAAPGDPGSLFHVEARAERESAVYRKGEPVRFQIMVTESGKPSAGQVDWVMVKDGLPTGQKGGAELKDGKAVAVGSLDEPGFLQVRVLYRGAPKGVPASATGGVAVEPEAIPRSLPVPEDFDAFWDGMKQRLAGVPVAPALVPVKLPAAEVDSYDVTAPALGGQISGYLSMPRDAKPRSLPVILTVHGAGVSDSSLAGSAGWAARGFLAMDMNAHGLPNGKPKQYYTDLYAGPMKGYRYENREDRERAYFTGMMLRLVRALDVLTARAEWDGSHVVVFGSSQGGYQAIAAAGLDPRVTFFAAGVPAGCDHSGMLVNRIAGWPKIVPYTEGKPDERVLGAYRYLDCMNFVTRTRAAGAYFTVGFLDVTCPPTSVYAAYNQLRIPKEIFHDVAQGHSQSPAAREGMTRAVLRHVGK